MSIKQTAENLSTFGLVCVPLKQGTKYPAIKEWEQLEETPLGDFKATTKGLGIVCGKVSNVFCFDIDNMDNWNKLQATGVDMTVFDETPCTKTPSGGLHYYFQYDEEILTTTNCMDIENMKSGFDIRSDKSQVVAPPSTYYASKPDKKQFEGVLYKWHLDFEDCEAQICPDWLKRLLTKKDKIKVIDDKFVIVSNEREDNVEVDFEAMDKISNVTNKSDYKTLTFEQVSEIVNNLDTDRFSNYDDWCHLLWSIARWAEENEVDEDDVIDMLDEYSQNCEGYKSHRDVAKKYNEAFKGQQREKKFTIGTVIHWLKQDNPSVLSNLFKEQQSEALKTIEMKEFDLRDKYVWVDFYNEHTTKTFESREAMVDSVRNNICRVLALVMKSKSFFLKKDTVTSISSIDKLAGVLNFTLTYQTEKVDKRTKDKKLKKVIEAVKLNELIDYDRVMKPYEDVGCYPDKDVKQCPDKHYNIWSGFIAEQVEVDESKIGRVKYILKELWASGDDKLYKYLLSWFRFCVANPAEMTKVALFLFSKEGAGKGTIVDFFQQYVLGRELSFQFTGIDQVIEKHQTNIKGKKLIYVNEMGSTKEMFLSNFDKIKPIITDPIISENPKNGCIVSVDNITNVIMSTNHKNSIHISENDRRYTCVEISDAKCNDKEFWAETMKLIMNQDTGNHFYSWLLTLDPSDLPNPKVVFKTQLREEIIEISRDNVLDFAEWFLGEEQAKEEEEKLNTISGSMLYSEYKLWCSNNGVRCKCNKLFGMAIKTVLPCKKDSAGRKSYNLCVNNA